MLIRIPPDVEVERNMDLGRLPLGASGSAQVAHTRRFDGCLQFIVSCDTVAACLLAIFLLNVVFLSKIRLPSTTCSVPIAISPRDLPVFQDNTVDLLLTVRPVAPPGSRGDCGRETRAGPHPRSCRHPTTERERRPRR